MQSGLLKRRRKKEEEEGWGEVFIVLAGGPRQLTLTVPVLGSPYGTTHPKVLEIVAGATIEQPLKSPRLQGYPASDWSMTHLHEYCRPCRLL